MEKFLSFIDKYRKWIMLVGFILIVGFLCTGFRFIPYLSSANWKGVLMILGGELNEDFKTAPLKYKINAIIGVINFFLMLSFFILSAISIILTFCKKNFYYSVSFGVLILSMYLSFRGQTLPALYYRIPLTIAFALCLTLELLLKYQVKAIAKFNAIIAKHTEKHTALKVAKQMQADAKYKQSNEYRIDQLEKELQELKAKNDNPNGDFQ